MFRPHFFQFRYLVSQYSFHAIWAERGAVVTVANRMTQLLRLPNLEAINRIRAASLQYQR